MANQGEFITAAEILNFKAALQTEVQRRSNSRSVGSMATYAGSAYQYTEPPNKDTVEFKSEHIEKITRPLDAITGGSLTPEAGGYVDADTLDAAALKVSELSGKSLTAATQNETGCAASCSGLCYTGCYSACTGCTGTCQGTCQGSCLTTCTGGCKNQCTSCGGSCSNNCTSGCSGGCKNTCSGSCSGGCYTECNSCGGSCANDCDSSCSGGCSGRCSSCSGSFLW